MDIYRQDILQFNAENIFPIESTWNKEVSDISPASPSSLDNNTCLSSLVTTHQPQPRVVVIGNLPFNISTPLVVQWLHDVAERRGLWKFGPVPMVLTFQKEVADRLAADAWGEQRCRLSILAQAFCEVKYLKTIPGTAFLPIPKVDAAIVKLVPLHQPLIPVPFPYVAKLVRCAFQFRCKQVVRGIETLFPTCRPDLVIQLFKEAAVQPSKRPTQLSIQEFRDLCSVYQRICQQNSDIFGFHYTARENLPHWHKRKQIQRDILGSEQTLNVEYVRQQMVH
ncbi:unnamed protein product [Dicrocoelium dendriticum]|nr:unnamed protein product [Dicrocoelium dendriticum]